MEQLLIKEKDWEIAHNFFFQKVGMSSLPMSQP